MLKSVERLESQIRVYLRISFEAEQTAFYKNDSSQIQEKQVKHANVSPSFRFRNLINDKITSITHACTTYLNTTESLIWFESHERNLGPHKPWGLHLCKLEYVYQMMIHAIYTFIYITHGIILKILLPNLWVFCLHLGLPLFLWTKYTICLKQ